MWTVLDDDDSPASHYDAAVRSNEQVRERLLTLLAALPHLTIEQKVKRMC